MSARKKTQWTQCACGNTVALSAKAQALASAERAVIDAAVEETRAEETWRAIAAVGAAGSYATAWDQARITRRAAVAALLKARGGR